MNYLQLVCKQGNCFGILTVYRVCFANALLSLYKHLFLSIFLLNVESSKEVRAKLQNSFWNLKLISWTAILLLSFFIPNEFFVFLSNWVYFPGATLFILIQIIILIDFAYSISEYFIQLWEDTYDNRYLSILLSLTASLYIASLIITILLYLWFGGDGCHRNQTFISINLIASIIVSLLSITPAIQEMSPKSGLAQASIVSIYTTYLITSSIMSTPLSDGDSCNLESVVGKSETTSIVLGSLLTFLALAYSTTRVASNSYLLSTQSKSVSLPAEGNDSGTIIDDEDNCVQYSYSLFHLIFCLATMYLAMILTNWNSVEVTDNTGVIGKSMAAVWVKAVSSWIVFLLYGWTLVAPILLPDREF